MLGLIEDLLAVDRNIMLICLKLSFCIKGVNPTKFIYFFSQKHHSTLEDKKNEINLWDSVVITGNPSANRQQNEKSSS